MEMKNLNDETLLNQLVQDIKEAEEDVYGSMFDLVSEVHDVELDNFAGTSKEKAEKLIENTDRPIWRILGTVQDYAKNKEANITATPVNFGSPVQVAEAYYTFRSIHFLVDAIYATFGNDLAQADKDNIVKLINAIETKQF